MPRFLFGPVVDESFRDRFLHAPVTAGSWAAFGAACPSWDAAVAATGDTLGGEPEVVLVWPAYTSVPAWVWSAPVPVVALAADANLLAHGYRHLLPLADLVLADAPSAERMRRGGVASVRAANLFGLDRHFRAEIDTPEGERPLDVAFVGNLSPAVQAGRARWLGRLGALAARSRVVIGTGLVGEGYRLLLRSARLVFNRSVRGECNLRALEAAASGAVLLQESENAEVRAYLEPGTEFAPYTEDDFETVVERLLADEGQRRAIADRAKERVRGYAFETLVAAAVGVGGPGWDEVQERAARRVANPVGLSLAGRVWQKAALSSADADPGLVDDLAGAGDRHGLAVVAKSVAAAEPHLAAAAAAGNRVSAVGHAAALVALGRRDDAVAVLRGVLADLAARPILTGAERDRVPYPVRFDHLRVGWDRAAFDHPDDPAAETAEKVALLTGRAAAVLAELTGELPAYRLAAESCPSVPAARAALGCALARAGQFAEGIEHLQFAVAHDPFDAAAARALEAARKANGDDAGAADLRESRRWLAKATSGLIPELEPPTPSPAMTTRFVDPTPPARAATLGATRPTGRELASIIVLCCNEVAVTRLGLESVLAHTRPPYELVLIDNGSSDGTREYLHTIGRRTGPERVTVVRNETNRGYPAGVNQGLSAARGEFLVLLNNDVVVTPGWLDKLVAGSLHDWPAVGLAGAVTNYAPPPQRVEPGYADLAGLDAFAARRAAEFRGRAADVPRLTGFCLLVRRSVFDTIGTLDEQFGLGFFDDDDLCLRARRAGFRLALVLDCYVHHFGSRTFRALGVDTSKQLDDNLTRYRAKWGAAEAAKYHRPAGGELPAAAPGPVTVLSDGPIIVPAIPRGRARVSLTMIVKNEEHHLPECLASVRDLVDEAVVVDTGSTDRTREVIAKFGCVTGEFPWVDDFAAARNAALDHATGDYAFWMDADDRLDPENRQALKAVIAHLTGGNDAYVLKCLCVPDKPGAGATVVDHVRLFRRLPEHRWKYRVHEQILPSLRATGASVTWSGVTVRHVGYIDPTVRRRKLDRDLRLLKLDEQDRPGDPFTLFNLGSVYNELGDARAAADMLARSLAGSHVQDSIVRKLYALLAQCHARAGDRARAAETLREGRGHYPADAELLFLAANLTRERGEVRAAEDLYRQLIGGREGDHFGSVDAGLRAVKGRHNLAVMLLDQNRGAESEGLWRAALVADPQFLPAHAGLGELYAKTGNAGGVAAQVAALRGLGTEGAAEAAVLEGRWLLARRDAVGAARVLEAAAREFPQSLGVRVALSHVRLAQNAAPEVLEAAFQGVLELDPANAQAKRNLQVLMRNTGRWIEGVEDPFAPGDVV